MTLPAQKTKIVCTLGPASSSLHVLERMIEEGMTVARLNFSHGELSWHRRTIGAVREASRSTGRQVAVMADLPGPKIRIGRMAEEPVELRRGEQVTLTTEEVAGDASRVTVNFERLPQTVGAGDVIFLSDGLIELEVVATAERDVRCRVRAGGELRSGRGVNIPGSELGLEAFTAQDRKFLECALREGVDAVALSFTGTASDVTALRSAASSMGADPFVIAKIERSVALTHYEEILAESDGIMVARGDLGVEIPIERMALTQKELLAAAVHRGKPSIVATQMLESMTHRPRPTRAEATDVANAVLDGADCVMLSGESAVGSYPVEAVGMLARIAAEAERHVGFRPPREDVRIGAPAAGADPKDIVAFSVARAVERDAPAAVVVPTVSGATARGVCRFRLPVWIAAVSPEESTCRTLQFSYGVWAVREERYPESWNPYVRTWVRRAGLGGRHAILTEGPSTNHPGANHRMEIIELTGTSDA